MFIAHAPSGYLLSIALLKRTQSAATSAILASGVLGALAPDFDLIYFFTIDHRHTHHHKYFTHWPIFWLCILMASAILVRLQQRSTVALATLAFSLGGMLHVVLDSVVGDIWWLAPFVDRPFALFTVQAVFHPWWLNFLLHWSFAVELGICAFALVVYRQRSNNSFKADNPPLRGGLRP